MRVQASGGVNIGPDNIDPGGTNLNVEGTINSTGITATNGTITNLTVSGTLTQGASAFALRLGPGGRIAAVPYQIPAAEAARDRGALQRLSLTHTIGRQMLIQRQRLRGPGRQGPNNQRPNNQRPNNQRPRGGQNLRPERAPQQPVNRPQRLPGQPRPRQRKNIFNQPKR